MRVILLAAMLFGQALQSGPVKSDGNSPIVVNVSFGNFDTPLRRLTVSLGELPENEKIDAAIRLVNVTQTPIEFVSLRKSCNCLEAKVENPAVQPLESAVVSVTLHTRLRSISADQVTTFQVETKQNGRVEAATISIEYTLKGVLAFPTPSFHHSIPIGSRSAEVRIPLLVTAPVMGSELEIDNELGTFPEVTQDRETKNKWWIALPLDPKLLKKDISLFKVRAFHPRTGRSAEATVTLERSSIFKISPRTLRFRHSTEEGILIGSSIIHVEVASDDKSLRPPQNANESSTTLTATATVEGKPIRVKIERLTKNVFRVETILHHEDLQLDLLNEPKIHWNLMCGKLKSSVTSPFVIDTF